MARLTLSFKDRKLKVFTLDPAGCLVGRDPDCDIVIDSLAVQPQHARISFTDNQYRIEPVDAACAISVDEHAVSDGHTLADGESVQIGKHCLVFSAAGEQPAPAAATVTRLPSSAWLQIQSGVHLGRTIRLNKAFTRVGKPNGELAVIAHRDNGYYLSTLQGEQGAQINQESIGEHSRQLHNGDLIVIGELRLQFFADGVAAQASAVPPAAESAGTQRMFSRVPFEVNVTLDDGQRQWNTRLVDISLHGALIETPEGFAPAEHDACRLTVHLEGGPDICMAVETAHHQDGRLGLRCTHIDLESITHLRRLVELNLGDPQLLERELSALG